jgi:hypothetical protein
MSRHNAWVKGRRMMRARPKKKPDVNSGRRRRLESIVEGGQSHNNGAVKTMGVEWTKRGG